MTDHNLLPCPFCGGEAEIWRASADPKRPAWVGCMGRCAVLVSRGYETTEEAIAAWNRRTPPAAVPDVSKTVKQRACEIADQLWLDTNEKSKLVRLICDAFSASPTPPVDERP